ncbi:MAG: hypothetical protein P1P78_11255 [Methyloprofundus sp.]|nr:hypothetical protein [Methyloprofundus sp.]
MTTEQQLKQNIEQQTRAMRCRRQLINGNDEDIAQIGAQSVRFQDDIDALIRAQQRALFALMLRLSHRKFMRYMRQCHGW